MAKSEVVVGFREGDLFVTVTGIERDVLTWLGTKARLGAKNMNASKVAFGVSNLIRSIE